MWRPLAEAAMKQSKADYRARLPTISHKFCHGGTLHKRLVNRFNTLISSLLRSGKYSQRNSDWTEELV
jgi:hypothetical protein